MPDLVSILIPAYNAEKWICQTIKSAIGQKWLRKEIIVVNDGSSDNTLAIARRFESKSVKVISQENRGASAARNKAYFFAQGDYIQWLDADDLLAPNKISEQMKIAEGRQESLTLYSSGHGKFYWRIEKARFIPNLAWQDLTPVDYLVMNFSENHWLSSAGWLVSRILAEKAGPWDERLTLNDDGEYFCRVVAACERIKFVPKARCYYRMSGFDQLSLSNSESAYKSMLSSVKLCIRHLRALEESEKTRQASLALLRPLSYLFFRKTELFEEINSLAFELGGELKRPKFSWKINLLDKLFGWEVANGVKNMIRRLRLAMAVKWDEMLYRIASSSAKGSNLLNSHRFPASEQNKDDLDERMKK